MSFRSRFYRRGICFPPAAKQQIPRAMMPRFGMTGIWGIFKIALPPLSCKIGPRPWDVSQSASRDAVRLL
jgi:hypothetical protein